MIFSNTINSWYITVKYNKILNTLQKEESKNFVQTMNSQKTAPYLTLSGGLQASFLSSLDKIYYEILGVHCI